MAQLRCHPDYMGENRPDQADSHMDKSKYPYPSLESFQFLPWNIL